MFIFVGLIIQHVLMVKCKDITVFVGRNPNHWDDTHALLYDSKGFFDPVFNSIRTNISSDWSWNETTNINMETLETTSDALRRSVQPGPSFRKILDLDEEFGSEFFGIIGVSGSTEGGFGSEISGVTFFHLYADSENSYLLEKGSEAKADVFSRTIRIGPPMNFVVNATLGLLNWLDTQNDDTLNINLQVIYENSFASEKIANSLKMETKSNSDFLKWTLYMSSFESNVFDGSVSDSDYFFRSRNAKASFFDDNMATAVTQSRVLIVIGSAGMIRQVAISLHRAVENDDNVKLDEFIIIAIPSTLWPMPSYAAADIMQIKKDVANATEDDVAKIVFQNMFVITEEFNVDRFEEISKVVKENFFSSDVAWTDNRPVPLWSGYMHDATLLFMKAVNQVPDRKDVYSYLVGKTWTADDFDGIEPFSDLEINEYGDRIWKLQIHHFDDNQVWEKVASYQLGGDFDASLEHSEVSWPGSGSSSPVFYPNCGYQGCLGISEENKRLIKIVVTVAVVLVVFMFVALMCIKRQRAEKELMDMGWRVEVGDLNAVDEGVDDAFSMGYSESIYTGNEGGQNAKQGAIVKTVSLESLDMPAGDHLIYMNTPVFTKPILPQFFTTMTKTLMKELKHLKDLRDEYIVSVIGLTHDTQYYWLVLEDCGKGTLETALEDEGTELDSNFKVSMVDDIAKGMSFLHNKTNLGSHGNLKTSNVLISNNFTMKISDFGRSIFLSDMKKIHHHSEIEHSKRLLWRSPELLRKKRVDINGTKQGDIYSFAIIVQEIITRQGPFNLHSLDNKETATTVILKVKDMSKENDAPFRPKFPESLRHKPLKMISIMTQNYLWSESEDERTSFKKICDRIKAYKPGKSSGTFLDTAVKRMEKFSGALEKKAAEKESQAKAEQKKVEELMEFFVPKVIIKKGLQNFKPELLEKVTVCVIELDGMEEAIKKGKALEDVFGLETRFRNMLDSISTKSGFYFGQGCTVHRVWVASKNTGTQQSHHHAVVKVAAQIMKKMTVEIADTKMNPHVSVKAGMHTGTIFTGLIGNGTRSAPKFDFIGVMDVADLLCFCAKPFEVLVTPESHSTIKSIEDKDFSMDFGPKQQYKGTEIVEGFAMKY